MLKDLYKEAQEKMKGAVEATERELKSLRTGRASVGLVENVSVSAYESEAPLKQLATISTPDARTIQIQPWDRNVLAAVEKAILAANLGLTPNNDGRLIRINIPPLTEERRKELGKVARHVAEEGRVAVRNVRRRVNDEIKATEKRHEISEDDRQKALGEVQKHTNNYIAEIDELLAAKEKEIMEL
ncbi:ribosome recycling factor [candidate division BRC1 bacterium SM23_51]|nr:MAG: ribosome recycling factor [candidate division BRC1 bacterium SM23_51]